jgi:hypothetical protein
MKCAPTATRRGTYRGEGSYPGPGLHNVRGSLQT